MSIISECKEAKKDAYRTYRDTVREAKKAETEAIIETIDVLRRNNRPMTAAQISTAMNGSLSKFEVAGNLVAIRENCSYRQSRFYNRGGTYTIPFGYSGSNGERIQVEQRTRKATVVEVDKNGEIIPNTKRTVTLQEGCRYSIAKTK